MFAAIVYSLHVYPRIILCGEILIAEIRKCMPMSGDWTSQCQHQSHKTTHLYTHITTNHTLIQCKGCLHCRTLQTRQKADSTSIQDHTEPPLTKYVCLNIEVRSICLRSKCGSTYLNQLLNQLTMHSITYRLPHNSTHSVRHTDSPECHLCM